MTIYLHYLQLTFCDAAPKLKDIFSLAVFYIHEVETRHMATISTGFTLAEFLIGVVSKMRCGAECVRAHMYFFLMTGNPRELERQ